MGAIVKPFAAGFRALQPDGASMQADNRLTQRENLTRFFFSASCG